MILRPTVIFSKVKTVENVLEMTESRHSNAIEIDTELDVDDWKLYESQTKTKLNVYNAQISVSAQCISIYDLFVN